MWKCRCSSTIFGIDGGSCVGSPSASRLALGRGARAGGCHPRGHACGDPLGKGRSAAVYLFPYGAGRASNGGFRLDIPVSRKRPAVRAGPASRPDPFEPLACGYRPRGWHPPALSSTEVACGESEELGFASWVGTLACLLCMASVALGTSRVRARACAPTPPQTADHALDMPQPALHLRPTYPWRRSPRCGRKANKAATPYPARLRPLSSQPTSVLERAGG